MMSSSVLLDLTLSGIEGQDHDWTNFSTQSHKIRSTWSSIGKYSWMTFIHTLYVRYVEKDFPRLLLGYHIPWGLFLV